MVLQNALCAKVRRVCELGLSRWNCWFCIEFIEIGLPVTIILVVEKKNHLVKCQKIGNFLSSCSCSASGPKISYSISNDVKIKQQLEPASVRLINDFKGPDNVFFQSASSYE